FLFSLALALAAFLSPFTAIVPIFVLASYSVLVMLFLGAAILCVMTAMTGEMTQKRRMALAFAATMLALIGACFSTNAVLAPILVAAVMMGRLYFLLDRGRFWWLAAMTG